MRKIFVLIGMLLSGIMYGQGMNVMHNGNRATYASGGGGAVDSASWEAEYKTYYYAMTTPPGIDTADKQNDFFEYLFTTTTYGDSLDAMWIYAQNNSSNAVINAITPGVSDATIVNTPVFTQWQGYTGDGSSAYINTNWNPTDDGSNWTQNDAAAIFYIRDYADTGNEYFFGVDGTNDVFIRVIGGSSFRLSINDAAYSTPSSAPANGVTAAVRRNSSENIIHINGTEEVETQASSGIPTTDIHILDCTGVAGNVSNNQVSLAIFSNGLSETAIEGITVAFEIYMDYLETGVL